MSKNTENPILDSHSYTFVSLQTLQNTFPEREPTERVSPVPLVGTTEPDPNGAHDRSVRVLRESRFDS